MNIKCLLGHHTWKFAYHHGMPFGIDLDDSLKMIEDGMTYSVDQCTRRGCGKQSRIIDGKRVMLRHGEMEDP